MQDSNWRTQGQAGRFGNSVVWSAGAGLPLFLDPVVVAAACASDKGIAGFGDDLVFGLIAALRAEDGDKH